MSHTDEETLQRICEEVKEGRRWLLFGEVHDFAKAVARRYAATVGADGWRPRLVGAEQLGTDRKGDVTINVPTALCWLQFRPEVTTGMDADTRPGVGFTLVAYPEARGEWPSGAIPRSEAARLHAMLGDFLAKHPPPTT